MSHHNRTKVAIVAPPWLALPAHGYGGIELVIEGIIEGLQSIPGVDVTLFANGAHKLRSVRTKSLFSEEKFTQLYKPYFESTAVVQAHLVHAYNEILREGDYDVIHDHNPHIGPLFWSLASQRADVPPVLHTFHGPPFTANGPSNFGSVYNTADIDQLKHLGKLFVTSISEAMSATIPKSLQTRSLAAVHNAIDVDKFSFQTEKKPYFITLARFAPYKGQHIAVQAAAKLHKQLRMAGTVSDIESNSKLLAELANPLSSYRGDVQFRYYSDEILPYVLRHPKITYSGNLSGKRKMKFIAGAKALLFPIQWDEPFGMAVIEALACGTPVIAMNKGAMPEIIKHGVNGFLAEDEQEFAEYMERIDEIDPARCRESVEQHFSSSAMAASYLDRYHEVIDRAKSMS